MAPRDKLDLSNKNFLDTLVDHRRPLVGLTILITIVMSTFIPRLDTDPTLKSGMDSTSPAYLQYQKFIKMFGDEEFILVAIHSKQETIDSEERLLHSLYQAGKEGLNIQRYKGLGEMNPEQLWQTTMNPETRTLLKVKVEDAGEADETVSILMGDEVEQRRRFIEENALYVQHLDI